MAARLQEIVVSMVTKNNGAINFNTKAIFTLAMLSMMLPVKGQALWHLIYLPWPIEMILSLSHAQGGQGK